MSNRKIAEILKVSEKCVRTTLKNYRSLGSPLELKRTGRPKKLSKRQEHHIFRKARTHFKWSYQDLADDFNQQFLNYSISRQTTRRVLSRFGIGSYIAIKKPLLTVKDRIKRLNWARKHQYWPVEEWAKVIFSDESNFEVFNRKGRIHVKRLRGKKFSARFIQPKVQGGGGAAGIWGCISHKGAGVSYLYTGRINRYTYKDCLDNCLLSSADLFWGHKNYIFMQDGAPAHTAQSVKDYFAENNIKVLEWCARSPDLNPIEHIWAWMDRQLARIRITSIEHLKEVLHEIWLTVPLELCMKLIE